MSVPFRKVSNNDKTLHLIRYLEESGVNERNRLTTQLMESKPEAWAHLRANPSSKVSPGPEELHARHRTLQVLKPYTISPTSPTLVPF